MAKVNYYVSKVLLVISVVYYIITMFINNLKVQENALVILMLLFTFNCCITVLSIAFCKDMEMKIRIKGLMIHMLTYIFYALIMFTERKDTTIAVIVIGSMYNMISTPYIEGE